MNLRNQRRIAADVLGCSKYRVHFETERLEDIKEAITKLDIRGLVKEGVIKKKPIKGVSRGRQRKNAYKKKRGQGKGYGKRKGPKTAREGKKSKWIAAIRSQRKLLSDLKDKKKITLTIYRNLYLKAKGGFFRNKRHIKLYIDEHKLMGDKK
jgi:large subunit ribosomal protein L19e